MSVAYCHLHGHSDYSIQDAISTPEKMAKRLHEIGQDTVALTDHGTMAGIASFNKSLKKNNIKLIAGNEMYVANLGVEDRSVRDTAHLTLLAINKEGYHNLCKLHSASWTKPAYYYNPRTDFDLLHKYNQGLIALSGCRGGVLLKPLHNGQDELAQKNLESLAQIFDKRFYIELQHHELEDDELSLDWLRRMAKKYKLPMVATNDYHYVNKADWVAHDQIIACGTGTKVDDPNRQKIYEPEQFYLKSYNEMAEHFERAVLEQSVIIADMCEPLDFSSKTFHLPVVEKLGLKKLRQHVDDGIAKRYSAKDIKRLDVFARVDYELAAIEAGGFTQYLLLLYDMYQFMEREGIPYGLGRGSAAASIVCYALGITGVCPLEYDLLFERFINPERISAPDIDCDISANRRGEVIDYLKKRWGEEKVVQIVTFGTIGARRAIRDTARVMRAPLELADKLAKLVPLNGSLTTDRESREYLAKAKEVVPEIAEYYATNETARDIIDAGIAVEGLIRSQSLHAAGIVIADRDVSDYVPLLTGKSSNSDERPVAVAYDMNFIEDIGLIKFDLLGLTAVDTIDRVVRELKASGKLSLDFVLDDIPLDDKATYAMLGKGLTQGVFQFESSGMAGWLRKMKPDSIDDLIAMVALYRPGPMEFIPNYVNRKLGDEVVSYPHKSLKNILESTYGICVYQEQIMQISQVVAGWSLSRADQLRKVIGKKIIDKMQAEQEEFCRDAVTNGFTHEWADGLFTDFIKPAAKYSFNKGHATVYGILAYRTAYLKAKFPCEYLAALLDAVGDDKDKVAAYIIEARALGVSVVGPAINSASNRFVAAVNGISGVSQGPAITFGMSSIKGVGEKAIQLIIDQRKKGPFKDLFDLVERTRNRLVTTGTLNALVYSGALDQFGDRATLLTAVPIAVTRMEQLRQDEERIQQGKAPVKRRVPIPARVLPKASPEHRSINFLSMEREVLGCYLSSHPSKLYTNLYQHGISVSELRTTVPSNNFTVVGIVSAIKNVTTKNKARMMTITLEDEQASIEVVIFPKLYSQSATLVFLDKPLAISGQLEESEEEDTTKPKMLAKSIFLPQVEPIRKVVLPVRRDINRYVLSLSNFHQQVAKAKAPCSFILPNGQELFV